MRPTIPLLVLGPLVFLGCGSAGAVDAPDATPDAVSTSDADGGSSLDGATLIDASSLDADTGTPDATSHGSDGAAPAAPDAGDGSTSIPPFDAGSLLDAGDASALACGACDTPPDSCHATTGTCVDGACTYAFVSGASCDDGNPCTVADTCTSGGCYGTPVVCTTPPAAVCTSGTAVVTYDQQGTCTAGRCVYTSHTSACASGPCVDGACSTDPCAGITCNAPPSSCYGSAGTCTNGSCSYPYADGTSCNDGDSCTTNDSCNTGVCKGVPLSCDSPPASSCVNASTLQAYAPDGTCSAGACSYTYSYVSCATGCAAGACNTGGWTTMASNTTDTLWALWGSSANAVWAVGQDGTADFYDGTQWEVRPVPSQVGTNTFYALHGSAADDVFAVAHTILIRFDGTSWSFVTDVAANGCTFATGVFATGDANDDVYVGCEDVSSETNSLLEVVGSGANAGKTTVVASEAGSLGFVGYGGGVWAFSPSDVLLSGCPAAQWNGTSLVSLGSSSNITSAEIWAASPSAVFTISYDQENGGSSVVELWNGSTWSPLNTGLNGTILAISGTSATRLFAAGTDETQTLGAVEYYDGTGFTSQTLPTGTKSLYAVYAAPTGEVFAAGISGTVVGSL